MAMPTPKGGPIRVTELWQGMTAPLSGRLSLLFAVAAPFTLLIDMTLRQFGPPQPTTSDDFTAQSMLWLIVVPALIGSLGQLAVAHLLLRPADPPRAALAAAFAVWPAYLGALLLSAFPAGLAILAFVLPGIYVTGRFFLAIPLAVLGQIRSPVELLRQSWQITAPAARPIFGFLLLAILAVFGLSLIASGVGGAIGSVLTLLGAATLAKFVASLVPAVAATFVAIGSAALSSHLYQRLAQQ